MLLVVIGGVPLALRKDPAAAAVCVPFLAALIPSSSLPPAFEIVDRAQSLYGLVQVIDDRQKNVRFMRVDHSVIGADRLPSHDSAFAFVHILELARVLRPEARSMLQLGLGTGSLVRTLERHGIQSDAVEIDPIVVRFARKHFNLDTASSNIFVEDARAFLNRATRKYDVVVHDTFTGGATPEHLLSREVLKRVQQILRPNGLVILNFVGGKAGEKAEASKLVARTLRSVFRNVRAFTDWSKADIANIVFFASDGPLGFEAITDAALDSASLERAYQAILANEIFATEAGEPVITDELNPLARMELPIADVHAAAMKRLLPMEVWLH